MNSDAQLTALKNAHAIEPRNFATTTAIGNALLDRNQQGVEGYKAAAEEALTWFQKSAALNPHLPFGPIGSGRCLDWLGRHDEAEASFKRAEKVDPNGYLTMAYLGWHYFQREQFTQSREWLEKSRALMPDEKVNPIPHSYLKTIAERLQGAGGR